jgi:hypothetical protein
MSDILRLARPDILDLPPVDIAGPPLPGTIPSTRWCRTGRTSIAIQSRSLQR